MERKIAMSTTQPIRNSKDIKRFVNYYSRKSKKPNLRNHALIVFGLHTALRISDILSLKWEDIYQFENKRYVPHLLVYEKKTGKSSMIALSPKIIEALEDYRMQRKPKPHHYVFSKRTQPTSPLCRTQAYRIIKKAAAATLDETHISCHSLRKTFGYHAWKKGASPVLLMDVYNHSSFVITKRYLGIEQDDRDLLFEKMDF